MDNDFLTNEYKKVKTLEDILQYFYKVKIGEYKTTNEKYNSFMDKNCSDAIYNMITQQYDEEDELYEKIETKRIKKKRKYATIQEPTTIEKQNKKEFYTRLNAKRFIYVEGDLESNDVKLYLSLGKENYADNIDRLIDIIYEIYIKDSKKIGLCKFRYNPANDAATLRLSKKQSEYFMELMKDNMDIIDNSSIKPNFLIPTVNKIGIIPDTHGSYNAFIAEIINNYIDSCVIQNIYPDNISFLKYVQSVEKDIDNYLNIRGKLKKYIGDNKTTADLFLNILEKAIINQMKLGSSINDFQTEVGKTI